jgi:hypothetical protein
MYDRGVTAQPPMWAACQMLRWPDLRPLARTGGLPRFPSLSLSAIDFSCSHQALRLRSCSCTLFMHTALWQSRSLQHAISMQTSASSPADTTTSCHSSLRSCPPQHAAFRSNPRTGSAVRHWPRSTAGRHASLYQGALSIPHGNTRRRNSMTYSMLDDQAGGNPGSTSCMAAKRQYRKTC